MLSPRAYNERVGLALVCPITSQPKDYPFEVRLPDGLPVAGVILSDQVKSLDWRARKAEVVCQLPVKALQEVMAKLGTLLSSE